MKFALSLGTALALTVGFVGSAAAQDLALPAPSPLASATQTVGVTQMTIEYSSPGVKGRQIFGELVAWDKMWRTGANAATHISFSTDVTIGGKKVPAGNYSVLTIPSKKSWTVIFNGDPKAAVRNYAKAKDAARISVKATTIPKRERMAFIFSNTTDAGTSLDLEWDTLRVSIPIKVDTAANVAANMKAFDGGSARGHARAARYLAESKQLDKALAHIDIAVSLDNSWFNNWIKAEILGKKGDYKAAYPFVETAWKLGQKAEYFFWKDRVKKALDEWKNK